MLRNVCSMPLMPKQNQCLKGEGKVVIFEGRAGGPRGGGVGGNCYQWWPEAVKEAT